MGAIFIFVGMCSVIPSIARAALSMPTFDLRVRILSTAQVEIEEMITVNFDEAGDHFGIIRDIPLSHSSHGLLGFALRSVTDERLVSRPYTESRDQDMFRLVIGDQSAIVHGRQTYRIRYDLASAIRAEEEKRVFVWDVVGNGWGMPIENSSVSVELPKGAVITVRDAVCYTGVQGSTEQACTKEIVVDGAVPIVRFTTTRPLAGNEGWTIIVQYQPSSSDAWLLAGGVAFAAVVGLGIYLWQPARVLVSRVTHRVVRRRHRT